MMSAARWALDTEYPNPVSSLMTLLSTVTEFTVEYFIPVDCIAEYNVSLHAKLISRCTLLIPTGCARARSIALIYSS